MRSWGMLASVSCSAIAGCGQPAFTCSDDAMCDRAPGGRCEPSGYCSFPDPTCASGQRFGEHAPTGLAMRCTEKGGDSEVDPTVADAGESSLEPPDTSSGSTPVPNDGSETNSGSDGPVDCTGWWDCAWGFRREIAIAGDVSETLEHFPVSLALDDVSDPERFAPAGADVRIVTDDGTVLPLDVELWTSDAPALVWTAIPSIEPRTGARAWLYYGNPSAPPEDTGTAVWDAGFVGVWHLSSTDDATAHENHAEDVGSVAASGMLGAGRAFDTPGEILLVPASASLADLAVDGLTITAWMRPNTPGFVEGGRIVDKANAPASTTGYSLLTSPTALGLEWNRGAATDEALWIDTDPLSYGRWHHVALSFVDGEQPHYLLDGATMVFESITPGVGAPVSDAPTPMGIGGAPYDDDHTFDGTLDEVRVSRGVRSEAWILAELSAATGRLVTLGPEETAPR